MKIILRTIILYIFVSACSSSVNTEAHNKVQLNNGRWKIIFDTQGYKIPIGAILNNNKLTIVNAEEHIEMDIEIKNDSFYVAIPNFNSHFEGIITSNKNISGLYIKDQTNDYVIPFTATNTQSNRFESISENFKSIQSKYEVSIERDGGKRISKAIGLFSQSGKRVFGSFATETGDYRYLEGIIDGDKLNLSTFDGSHLFLFTADIQGDSLINGVYISGKSGNYKWLAVANKDFELRNPEQLTFVKNGADPNVNFKLISTSGDSISLADGRFKDKVKIVQIMGTWCPNCLDETRYFNSLYAKYNNLGLEIVSVAFENGTETTAILDKLNKYKTENNIKYTLLYGGKAGNKYALEVFPYLNKVMSFPTAIYLDKNNAIRKIYTGFYGPGTGKYYEDYTIATERFIEELLAE